MLLLKGVNKLVEVSIALLFLALAFFMLQGKGACLIAGFNTLSKEEQAKYDQSALAKFVGKLMLLIGCCVLLFLIESLWVTLVSTAIVMIAPLAAVIYMNTGQRFRKHK